MESEIGGQIVKLSERRGAGMNALLACARESDRVFGLYA